VVAAQSRLRALLAANKFLLGPVQFPEVLRRIVAAACRLVDARYGALAVLARDGEEVYQLITSGAAPPTPGPDGQVLTVAVYVRDVLFGRLTVADSVLGGFAPDDEELLTALAATAGVVIENARLFEQARRRQGWLESSALVTRRLLSSDGDDSLQIIAREARTLADADFTAVARPIGDGSTLVLDVVSGSGEDELRGYTFPANASLTGRALAEGRQLLVADLGAEGPAAQTALAVLPIGAAMVLPLAGTSELVGALLMARNRGRRPFDENDLEMAGTFANHAAVALELAAARADHYRMAVLEERDRIARELHDHVIQRLFAAGLSVQGVAVSGEMSGYEDKLNRIVGDIDDTIRQVRSSVFELRGGNPTGSVRERLQEVVGDVARTLPATPTVAITDRIDEIADEHLESDLAAVLREALTNVARHAAAVTVDVHVTVAGGRVRAQITDDGIGIGASGRRSGLENLRRRAAARGGILQVEDAPVPARRDGRPGTRLVWAVPLTG
jgi:signal transduction histidine kinase